jgi:hypothetical protein
MLYCLYILYMLYYLYTTHEPKNKRLLYIWKSFLLAGFLRFKFTLDVHNDRFKALSLWNPLRHTVSVVVLNVGGSTSKVEVVSFFWTMTKLYSYLHLLPPS